MPTLNDKRVERGRLIEEMRHILDAAEKEKRALTSEEDERWNRLDNDQDALGKTIEKEERQQDLDAEMQRAVHPPGPELFGPPKPDLTRPADARSEQRATPEYARAFNSFITRGLNRIDPVEMRALQSDVDSAGGYIVAPEQFVNQLLKGMDDLVFMRKLATIIPVPTATSLGVPTLESDPSDANWTSEVASVTEDSSMGLGKRSLFPHPLSKLIKMSNELMRIATIPAEQLVRNRLAYKFGISQEKAFLTGNGLGQPLGVFIPSANGISTNLDVNTDNTSTAVTADGLINAKYALKFQYMTKAVWLFHRDTIKMIRKLKSTTSGDYVWRAGLATDRPDTILDLPYYVSEYCPNTFTTGLYVGILGDFSFYWIADSLDFSIQVLDQLYAANNQTGYIGRMKTDGAPVLEEAFVRVKLG